jgi:hypothetical protein
MGGVPAGGEAFPEGATGADGRGYLDLVLLAGGAEFGEESAVIAGLGGEAGEGFRADASIDFDVAEGDLQDFGGSTEAAVEGGITQEGFEAVEVAPLGDGVGVGEDVFAGDGFSLVGQAFVDEVAELGCFGGVVSIVDAGDFEGAATIGLGEAVDGELATLIAPGFAVDDEGGDGDLIVGAGGHDGWSGESKPGGAGNEETRMTKDE